MNFDEYFASEILRFFLATVLGTLACAAAAALLIYGMSKGWKQQGPACTTSQLHEVIEKVEECSKQNVVCSTKMKDKILSEVCK